MGNSLIDQMKKAGLVDKTKAHKARQEQYKNKKKKSKKGSTDPLDEAKLLAQKAQLEKVERDRQINLKKKEETERKAIAAQIIQLIETNRVDDCDGEVIFNFTDDNVVKRMFVSELIHKHLSSGKLSIVRFGEGYELVPKAVAEKIEQRDAQCVINNEDVVESVNDEDPYADYKIPDDLIW
ncbi:MAG: DUF2058 domain-containing protein [Proteobacteria bacterium]|nr:DUF2058 domain-containing protein [Pseudomonadota bacterium]NOG60041.1 DUF2058 domain-containing protein [Pseudomonadota bacterium]